MKSYFSYGMSSTCGIPNVTLLGTIDDWHSLRTRAKALGALMMPEFSDKWMSALLPILDECVASYQGNVNHHFWQPVVKPRHMGRHMSGGHPFISGWVQLLFPYRANGKVCLGPRKWQDATLFGPKLADFPFVSSKAPVDWDYHGRIFGLDTPCTKHQCDAQLW